MTTDLYDAGADLRIVVPLFVTTLTLAGTFFGTLRFSSGSVWPVAVPHGALNVGWDLSPHLTETRTLMNTALVNEWVKQALVDSGKRAGVSSEMVEWTKALERENHELREANAILHLPATTLYSRDDSLTGFVEQSRVAPVILERRRALASSGRFEILLLSTSGFGQRSWLVAVRRRPRLRFAVPLGQDHWRPPAKDCTINLRHQTFGPGEGPDS